ncbi:MAG TPA: hypothetical protein VF006_22120 [Longimicrobium sp.]
MRFTHLAALAALATLAACSDAPITQAEATGMDHMSQVKLYTPDQYAAHGIASLPASRPAPAGPSFLIDNPCEIDNPDSCGGEPTPPPEADADWWGGVFNESSCCTKSVRLHAKSDAHNNMDQTTLTVSFRSAGGCYATPTQFSSETQTRYGAPVNITIERYATYSAASQIVWETRSSHKFIANAGYVLPTGVRTATYPSGGKLCV